MPLRPRPRRPDRLVVAGVLALVGVVCLVLGAAAVEDVDLASVRFPDPGTGLRTVPGPSVADASAREGRAFEVLGAASLVAALGALLLHLRR